MECLDINLKNYVWDMYAKNYKILVKKLNKI